MPEGPSDGIPEREDPLSWRAILRANPTAQTGSFNPERMELLKVGTYVDLSRKTAESWVLELSGKNVRLEENGAVRVTIIEIPEETKKPYAVGNIIVDVGGIRATIDASVFSNCIKGPERDLHLVGANGSSLIGLGGATPTRGDRRHYTSDSPDIDEI